MLTRRLALPVTRMLLKRVRQHVVSLIQGVRYVAAVPGVAGAQHVRQTEEADSLT